MRRPLLPVLGAVILGLVATAFWLSGARGQGFLEANLVRLLPCLPVVCALTSCNLGLRWWRWHFLTRRLGLGLATRDSLRLYLATLPAIVTPFYVGELVRVSLLQRRYPRARRPLLSIWVCERITDAAVLVVFLFVAQGEPVPAALTLVAWCAALWRGSARLAGQTSRRLSRPALAVALWGSSAAAWSLPIFALWIVLWRLHSAVTVGVAASTFAGATLLGGISGLPLGLAVTGSDAIVRLQHAGVSPAVAPVAIAVWRAGTAWFAVALGLVALLAWKRSLKALLTPAPAALDHFDTLAPDYEEQIAPHVRERLLGRKVGLMHRRLREIMPGDRALRGLDVGCGHGWYACAMAELGYAMTGLDQSAGQIAQARAYAAEHGADVAFEVVDAGRLAYDDASFDFAYSVNVIHHIIDPDVRRSALNEAVRVLKPGGVYFLHEINVLNPLFRFYMGYVFPLLRDIDEGTELWIQPGHLPPVAGAHWLPEIDYFTFLPDFTPRRMLPRLLGVEAILERSLLRPWSAHYMASLVKEA